MLGVLVLVLAIASLGTHGTSTSSVSKPTSSPFFPSFLPSVLPTASEVPPVLAHDVEALLHSEQRQRRLEAARIVLAYENIDDLPPHLRLVAELETARGCREKKPIVVRIGELGDARALESVERVAAVRSSGGVFGVGASDPYECMRDELGVTLGVLREAAGVPSDGSGTKR